MRDGEELGPRRGIVQTAERGSTRTPPA
jgi:hypothetical protein